MIFGDDGEQKNRIKRSRKQERQTADRYKGSRNAGSGSGWLRKNDVRSHEFLIENKFTDNQKQYSVKLLDLIELQQRAILEDRIPVLQFEIQGKRFVILPEDDFTSMFNG
jgi:hypothetical protein